MYFENCKTLEELKKEYKRLALKYHPDRPEGDLELMKIINNEYEIMFERLQKISNNNNEKTENVNDFRDIIDKIINFNINIEICGSWIWLSGSTYQYKEVLKELGFKWSANKKMWYYRPENYYSKKHKAWTIEEIRNLYGSEKIKTEQELAYIAG